MLFYFFEVLKDLLCKTEVNIKLSAAESQKYFIL